jgi:hypothetical protein
LRSVPSYGGLPLASPPRGVSQLGDPLPTLRLQLDEGGAQPPSITAEDATDDVESPALGALAQLSPLAAPAGYAGMAELMLELHLHAWQARHTAAHALSAHVSEAVAAHTRDTATRKQVPVVETVMASRVLLLSPHFRVWRACRHTHLRTSCTYCGTWRPRMPCTAGR